MEREMTALADNGRRSEDSSFLSLSFFAPTKNQTSGSLQTSLLGQTSCAVLCLLINNKAFVVNSRVNIRR